MNYLVFNTEEEAEQAQQTIFAVIRQNAEAAGYDIAEDGSIIGKADGVSNPDAMHTSGWDTPMQRVDGKWVILHPEKAKDVANSNQFNAILSAIPDYTVEQEANDWWPEG